MINIEATRDNLVSRLLELPDYQVKMPSGRKAWLIERDDVLRLVEEELAKSTARNGGAA